MKQTFGNSFRYNNLDTVNTKAVICICDEETASLCEVLSDSFLNTTPFGYIGIAPWFKRITNALPTNNLSTLNKNITDLFLKQTEISVVVYLANCPEYNHYIQSQLPNSTHLFYNPSTDNINNIITQCNDITASQALDIFPKSREWAEWLNVSFSNDIKQKKLLIVGDSISCGYTPFVRELLPDYTVDSINTSEGTNHQNIFDELALALNSRQYDIIHFNNGIHLHNITTSQYAENLTRIFDFIQNTSPSSKLIFGNTSTVNKLTTETSNYNTNNFQLGDRDPTKILNTTNYGVYDCVASEKYIKLNDVAQKICADRNISITDFFHLCVDENLPKTDRVHFTDYGYQRLADLLVSNL